MSQIVSILVLVDSSLRLGRSAIASLHCLCFNPCFSGFVITTLQDYLFQFPDNSFNPCFSGFVITTIRFFCHACNHRSFNPCFSGFVITTRERRAVLRHDSVSILVLVDSSLRPKNRSLCVCGAGYVSILVLVDSSLRLRADYVFSAILQSFNPCFSGFVITTQRR